ncbi:MAG TPA: hypothetical protein VMT61_19555 [Candidatus Binataceae bacterium]|nr:hypothetical protein [Candidatus Binataceae bacterium]
MESATEVVDGVSQLVYKLPLDGKKTDIRADLDLSRLVDRLIIGPGSAQFNSAMKEAFINALANAGVTDTDKRVVESGIPLRN